MTPAEKRKINQLISRIGELVYTIERGFRDPSLFREISEALIKIKEIINKNVKDYEQEKTNNR